MENHLGFNINNTWSKKFHKQFNIICSYTYGELNIGVEVTTGTKKQNK